MGEFQKWQYASLLEDGIREYPIIVGSANFGEARTLLPTLKFDKNCRDGSPIPPNLEKNFDLLDALEERG